MTISRHLPPPSESPPPPSIIQRLCIECGAKATKKVIIDSETATHIMYYCDEHVKEAEDHSKIIHARSGIQ